MSHQNLILIAVDENNFIHPSPSISSIRICLGVRSVEIPDGNSLWILRTAWPHSSDSVRTLAVSTWERFLDFADFPASNARFRCGRSSNFAELTDQDM